MSSDIVKRLRNRYPDVVRPHLLTDAELIGAAVVEIERLRTALKVAANHMSMTGAPQTTIDAIRNAVRGG